MILVIDNYDSFTYNLVQYLGELGASLEVRRNDRVSIDEIERLGPSKIVISPGPCTPNEAGISLEVVRRFGPRVPILGVCLGHQAIGQAYGGRVVRAGRLMHGKPSSVSHNGAGIFDGLENPLTGGRYHSLVIEPETLPECLEVTARSDDGAIMGLRHREHPVVGLQFHPESVLTPSGKNILANFLSGRF